MSIGSQEPSKAESAMTRNAGSLRGRAGNYFAWNLRVFHIEQNKRILDVGCGPALYFEQILAYAPAAYVAADLSDTYLDVMRKSFASLQGFEALKLDLTDPTVTETIRGRLFDYVFCFDVLEHITKDDLALDHLRQIAEVSRAGKLFLRVPALPWIYGANDAAIGHCRRYTAKSLKGQLEKHGLHVERIRYQNMLGVIPWFVIGRILRRATAVSGGEAKCFNALVPVLAMVERCVPPPIGLSLYAVCSIDGSGRLL
jgi:SAM-dependent methyltransferase